MLLRTRTRRAKACFPNVQFVLLHCNLHFEFLFPSSQYVLFNLRICLKQHRGRHYCGVPRDHSSCPKNISVEHRSQSKTCIHILIFSMCACHTECDTISMEGIARTPHRYDVNLLRSTFLEHTSTQILNLLPRIVVTSIIFRCASSKKSN